MKPSTPLAALAARFAAAPPRVRAPLVAGAAAAAILLALASDPILAAGGRAALVALALGAAGLLLRRRAGAAAAHSAIDVEERSHLSRDATVALLRVGGRRLLVGYGTDGVRLLADLGDGGPSGGGRQP